MTSAESDDRKWLIVGRVGKPHGVRGDVLVDVITDFPDRLIDGTRFGLGDESGPGEFFVVHRVRDHKGRWLVSIQGIRDRETIEGWRGRYLYLPEQAIEDLPEGYFYEHHLMGLECRSAAGEVFGHVTELDFGLGQSRLVVEQDGHESMVPYVPEIVREVDLEKGIIIIDPPAGLFDDAEDDA